MSNIDYSLLVTPEIKAESELIAKRETTSLHKSDFCNAIADAGIISDDEAVSASKGEWPSSMNEFLAYLDAKQARDIQIEWASCDTIKRNHVFVLSLGSWLGLSDGDLDNLFGID